MSYALELTSDALQGLQSLDAWLQEEALDELDALAIDPSALRIRHQGVAVHDFIRAKGTLKIYIFITVMLEQSRKTLHVTNIAQFIRSGD